MPEKRIIFNSKLAFELCWLDVRTAFHMVDIATGDSNLEILTGQNVEEVLKTFVNFGSQYIRDTAIRCEQTNAFNSHLQDGGDVKKMQELLRALLKSKATTPWELGSSFMRN